MKISVNLQKTSIAFIRAPGESNKCKKHAELLASAVSSALFEFDEEARDQSDKINDSRKELISPS